MSGGSPVSDAERLARVTLTRIAEPAVRALVMRVREVGASQLVAEVRDGRPLPGVDVDGLRHRLSSADPERDLDRAAAVGARFVCPGDPDWPRPLDDLAWEGLDCLGLWVRGPASLAGPDLRAIGVVGTRVATAYGQYVANEFGRGLAEREWAVVSGLAYGIDAAAHRGALTAGGATLAALACGVDVAYPKNNRALYDRICAEGAVISEHPPGTAPQRPRFLVRNRLIAALSAGTVVVEMAIRSGARATATYAARLNRHVMAVPGPITSAVSAGCHQLLRDRPDTVVVTRVEEIVEQCGHMGEVAEPLIAPPTARDLLGPTVRQVFEGVPVRGAAAVDTIAATAGVGPAAAAASLAALAQLGLAAERAGLWAMTPTGRHERRHRGDPLAQLALNVW
ncbi:MAG: processing protein [Frankiaceae bacterium]|jgi:DNA processing protein|nr:processing protein [Frankiaceae bacterium]